MWNRTFYFLRETTENRTLTFNKSKTVLSQKASKQLFSRWLLIYMTLELPHNFAVTLICFPEEVITVKISRIFIVRSVTNDLIGNVILIMLKRGLRQQLYTLREEKFIIYRNQNIS